MTLAMTVNVYSTSMPMNRKLVLLITMGKKWDCVFLVRLLDTAFSTQCHLEARELLKKQHNTYISFKVMINSCVSLTDQINCTPINNH